MFRAIESNPDKEECDKTEKAPGEQVAPFHVDIPKIEVDKWDSNCFQASIRMVLEHLGEKGSPTIEELANIGRKEDGVGTWPGFTLSWLVDQGYKVEMFSNFNLQRFSEGGLDYLESDEFKRRHSRDDAPIEELIGYITRHDIGVGMASSKELVDKGILKVGQIELEQVLKRVSEGEDAILLIDNDHYIVLTGFDGENIYYNDPSAEGVREKKKEIDRFMEKWGVFNLYTVIFIKSEKAQPDPNTILPGVAD